MNRVEDLNPHTLVQLSEELKIMSSLVLKMGGLVEARLSEVIKALRVCDLGSAKSIATSDYKVNILEMEIDAECTKLLALHHLVASDLRLVIMSVKMVIDLERIGDEAQKIAKQVPSITSGGFSQTLLSEINAFGERANTIVHLALDGFARLEDQSRPIREQDRLIDQECQRLISHSVSEMEKTPENIKSLLSVIWCVRALERIGDHAKNIGEYTVFMLKGIDVRHVLKDRKVG